VETIVGARRDPELGEVLLFGAGGVLAEVARDRSLRTLPCAEAELEEMVSETRLAGLLDGMRGRPAVDRGPLFDALRAVARLILSLPEVADVEVNPLRCAPEGVVALDARVLLEPAGAVESGAAP
jgi:acyl-CoA synthetase (NDP forming)